MSPPVIERIALTADSFMSMTALSQYSSLSIRTLRSLLSDPARPLPHYRIGARVTVRKSDFDEWARAHRRVGVDLEEQIDRLQKRQGR